MQIMFYLLMVLKKNLPQKKAFHSCQYLFAICQRSYGRCSPILAAMNDFDDTCRTDFPDYLQYLFVRFLLNKRDLDIIIILVYIVIYL